MELFVALAAGSVFGIGIFHILQRNMIRAVIGIVLIGNAVNLFLLSAGAYNGEVAAYTTAEGQRSDAFPQALILTAIVISMGGFAFVLALLSALTTRVRTGDSDDVSALRF